MENASKALILAAEILIGVLLLTLMVFTFRAMSNFSDTIDENIETKNINEFNVQFEKYRGKSDLTAQDVISIGNLAKQYNQENEVVTVILSNAGSKYQDVHKLTNEKIYKFISSYNTDPTTYFTCTDIEYNTETGKVNKIKLEKVN